MGAFKDQHFLTDERAVEKIADAVPVSGRTILEIGPGGGVLTRALLDRGAVVHAVELDTGLIPNLEQRFADELADGRLTITLGDASKVPLPPYEAVVANLPYSISSKITFRLLEEGFEEAVLMYQLEFAKRMAAVPHTSDYGRLSVTVQAYADVELILELPPHAFSPAPEVWSAVVIVRPRPAPVPIEDRDVFENVVRELFSHRRKTIANGFKGLAAFYGKEAVKNFTASLDSAVLEKRPEVLSVAEFIELSNTLCRFIT
ncbi:MAG TPA: 16S rRNA (adenine(1518)-N(6)/adenine(1519)-N(6))-dimethyltransferase RsmA [Methanocorpusculum sp.]|nr:16S rRNA (adenine(1518)-N(6)/adenine(1519)-N(6))-dimethyltransferase RsmA [Methanocorpusculum sp.]